MIHPVWVTSGLLAVFGWAVGVEGVRGEGSAQAIACEGGAEERLEAGKTPRMPFPVPWPAGCGGRSVRAALVVPVSVFPLSGLSFSAFAAIALELSGTSVRAGMALVTGGAGWAGPAGAHFVLAALILVG